MDRLLREGNPPVGQLASPVPQYKRPGSTDYEPVEGQHGAPFATLKDASGNVVSPATDAKLEQVKSELELVKSELQTIKANQLSGDQKVQLSGTNVVKQEVVLQRGIYSKTTERKILNKPPEARGLHLFCRVFGRTGTFGDGQGISLACVFNRGNLLSGITSYGLQVITDTSTSNYASHHIFIGPDFVGLGDAKGEFAIVKVSPMVLTTTLNFGLSISGTFEAGEGFDTEVTAVWVR